MNYKTILSAVLLALPLALSAHGGMQKIAEGKYLVNISSAPIAPYVGQEQQNIIALSDVETNSLIELNSVFDIEIRKDEKVLYAESNVVAEGGLLQFNYTYPEPGIYELFTRFHLPDDDHVYEPEDFWIQVHPAPSGEMTQEKSGNKLGVGMAIGIAIGISIGGGYARRKAS